MTQLDPPAEDSLRAHLIATRIAGDVATSRRSNTTNIDRMLEGEPDFHFGVTLTREWTFEGVLAVMAKRVGMDPAPERRSGSDRIDPDLTLAGLADAADRIAAAVRPGARILIATGHPTGLLSMYVPIAAALLAAGCTLPTPADGRSMPSVNGRSTWIRYVGPIACLGTGADLLHSHRTEPMIAMLSELDAAGEPTPDLVIADHGWAGAAAQAGLPTIGFADTNDPGVFIAAEQGLDIIAVPLDDNVPRTTAYEPLAERLIRGLSPNVS